MDNEIRVAGYIPQDDLKDEADAFLRFVLSRGKSISEKIGINEAGLDEQSVVANGIAGIAQFAEEILEKMDDSKGMADAIDKLEENDQ